MILIDVLDMFDERINKLIEKIEYNGSPEDFTLSFTVKDEEGNTQIFRIELFSNGETGLYIEETWDEDWASIIEKPWVFEETIEIYSWVKSIWKKNVV